MLPDSIDARVAALTEFVGAAGTAAVLAPALSAASIPIGIFPAAAADDPVRLESALIAAAVPIDLPYAGKPNTSQSALRGIGEFPSPEQRQRKALLGLALQATAKVIDRFEPLLEKILGRIRIAEKLKFWSQMLTMVLSSTVVGSMVTGKSQAGIILGFLTLGASLLGVAANNILGGDSKFVDEFGEASARFEAAKQLYDRLLIYEKEPNLFVDTDDRIKEADDLRRYLTEKIAKWGLTI